MGRKMGQYSENYGGKQALCEEGGREFYFKQERELALRSEGVKMTVASEQPHLLGVDEDRFSAGVVLYYLKVIIMMSL